MNEAMMKDALEAIVVIEEDSPAAFRAARLIAQETLDRLEVNVEEAIAVGCNATGANALVEKG